MGYNLSINTKFNPFTYDEMVKPLLLYKEAYDKAEEDFTNLIAQAADINEAVNRGDSPISAGVYNDYTQNLSDIAADFSKGMTLGNRQALTGLRRRYLQDIQPIAKANARRNALIEEQRQMKMKDPTMIWDNNAEDISLDTIVVNPNASYNPGYSGSMLTAEAAQAYGALAREYQNNPEAMRKLVGGDYYEYIKQRGFTSDAILEAIMNSDKASPVLVGIRNQILDKTGIRNWGNKDAVHKAEGAINMGMWQAMGQTDTQLVNNWRSQENLQHAHAIARARLQHELESKSDIVEIVDKDGKPFATPKFMSKSTGYQTTKDGRYMTENDDLKYIGNSPVDFKVFSALNSGDGGSKMQTKLINADIKNHNDKSELMSTVKDNKGMEKLGYKGIKILIGDEYENGKKKLRWADNRSKAKSSTYGFLGSGNELVNRRGYMSLYDIEDEEWDYVDPGSPLLPADKMFPSIADPEVRKELIKNITNLRDNSGYTDIQVIRLRPDGGDTDPNDASYAIYAK